MSFDSLVQEPGCIELLKDTASFAADLGYENVEPTPLVSPFWNTTFTPSVSEAIFRVLDKEPRRAQPFFAPQPCVRITDLLRPPNWGRPLFHMAALVQFGFQDSMVGLEKGLDFLTQRLGCQAKDLFFTVSDHSRLSSELSHQSVKLDSDWLRAWGARAENVFVTAGTNNYQDAHHRTGRDYSVGMKGPKIEIYIQTTSGKLREVATILASIVSLDKRTIADVTAFVFGVERLAATSRSIEDLSELPAWRQFLEDNILPRMHASYAKSSLARDDASQILPLLDALVILARKAVAVPFTEDMKNHWNRIARELLRRCLSCGIPADFVSELLPTESRRSLARLLKDSNKRLEYA